MDRRGLTSTGRRTRKVSVKWLGSSGSVRNVIADDKRSVK